MQWVARILAALVVLAAGAGSAQQQPARLALVIGNALYTTPGWQLVNPVNDAQLIAARLRTLGFQVTPLMNGTKAQMEVAMNAFGTRLRAAGPDAVGVFYYAGHGVEHDGANLLIPVDVTARSMDELRYQAPPMQFLLRDMASAGNAVNIIILDACRNLPLPAGARDGPAGGLADMENVPTNALIAYATRPGLTAPDNPGETNSVFTRTLAQELEHNPGDTAVSLFSEVQARVFTATGGVQRPEFRMGLLRAPRWRFAASSPPSIAPPTAVVRPPVTSSEMSDALLNLDDVRIADFLRRGWNPNSPLDAEGNTALHNLMIVCERFPAHDANKLAAVARILIDAGADKSRQNRWSDTPLTIARSPR